MIKRFIYSAAFVAVIALASTGSTSCSGGTGGGAGGGSGGGAGGGAADPDLTCDASPPATSLTKVMSDILIPDCESCHKAGQTGESYGIYTTAAAAHAQVGKKSLFAGSDATLKAVDPGSLGTSTMWLKVLAREKSPSGKNIGTPMPQGAPALNATQKKLLKDWICSGAAM
jgi:hypothetical protein